MIMKGGAVLSSQGSAVALSGNDIPLLLTTKLNPPRLGRGILPRHRLERLLEQVLERRVTLLKSPPGFGKTTLAAIWADQLPAQAADVAWLSLDEQDESVQRLLFYLAAALNRARPDLGKACLGLRAELSFFSMETLASLLIDDLSRLDRPLVLFIDDCHRINEQVLIRALRFFIQRAPDLLHVVFIGRRELPGVLVEHLYADDLLELDAGSLRFTLGETRDLLKKAGLSLDQPGDLVALQQLSDGWIAALRAFILSPQSCSGGQLRLSSRSLCALFEDMLRDLQPLPRQQLQQLALLEKFSPDLLAELFGQGPARALLMLLLERQLFVSALDAQERWFALHPLFREYLRRAEMNPHPQEDARQIACAARWFAARRHWLDAIRLGLDSGQTDQVKVWLDSCAMELLEQGDFSTLVMLEKRWTLQVGSTSASLTMARAWAMGLALQVSAANTLLGELELELGPQPSNAGQLRLHAEIQTLRAMLLGLADHNEASGRLAQHCYELASHRPWINNVLLNLLACSHYHASRWDAFYTLPPTCIQGPNSAGLLFHDCYRQSIRALAEGAQGRLQDGLACLQDLLMRIDRAYGLIPHRPDPALLALPHALLAQLRYCRGEQLEAEVHLAECMDFIATGGFLDSMAAAYCTQARLHWHQGCAVRARRILEQLDMLASERSWRRLRSRVLLERTWLNLLDNKPREAIACSHALVALAAEPDPEQTLDVRFHALLSGLWLALNGLDYPLGLLQQAEQLLDELAQRQLQLMHAELALSLGVVYSLQDRFERGHVLLDQALHCIQTMGALSLLQDLPLEQACERLAERVPAEWWARAEALLVGTQLQAQVVQNCSAALLGLTVKERQVIQLVAEGKSNKQIARDLGVTPETIKSHMKSIFSKLKVDNRAQAAVMLQSGQNQ